MLIARSGLDPARYAQTSVSTHEEKQFFTFESQISDKERFKDSETLVLRCSACEGSFGYEGLLENTVSRFLRSLTRGEEC